MPDPTLDLLRARLAEVQDAMAPLEVEAARLTAAIEAVEAIDGPSPRRRRSPARRPRRSPRRTRRAGRGENRAKILAALRSGPKTAGEVEEATGISARTAASTLTTMKRAGLVRKAARGYALA